MHRVWATLKLIYEKTKALVTDLMRWFRITRCGEDDDLRTHFEHLGSLMEQLAGMGKLISDKDYTDILIASLPSSYEANISSISNSAKLGSKPLTADVLEKLILDDFTQRELRKSQPASTKDEAFVAEAPKSKKRCNNCNKRGHFKADCWAKGGGKEGQRPRRNACPSLPPPFAQQSALKWPHLLQLLHRFLDLGASSFVLTGCDFLSLRHVKSSRMSFSNG